MEEVAEVIADPVRGSTQLRFLQHFDTDEGIGEIGPGWEYHLDMLVAARRLSLT